MSKNADEVDAIRYERTYDGDPIYIVISHEAKEVFISSVNEKIPKVISIYTSLTRMITMAWQNHSTEEIIKQLSRSSMSKFDLPGILAELLAKKE